LETGKNRHLVILLFVLIILALASIATPVAVAKCSDCWTASTITPTATATAITPIPTSTGTPFTATPVPMPPAATFPKPNYVVPTSIPTLSMPSIPAAPYNPDLISLPLPVTVPTLDLATTTPVSLTTISTTLNISYTAPYSSISGIGGGSNGACVSANSMVWDFNAGVEGWTFEETVANSTGTFDPVTLDGNDPGSLKISGDAYASGEWRYYINLEVQSGDSLSNQTNGHGQQIGMHFTDDTDIHYPGGEAYMVCPGTWCSSSIVVTETKQLEYVYIKLFPYFDPHELHFDNVTLTTAAGIPQCASYAYTGAAESILISGPGYISDMVSYTAWLSGEIATMQATNTFTIATAPAWYAPDLPRPMADVGYTFELMQVDIDTGTTRYSLTNWASLLGHIVSLPVQLAKTLYQIAQFLGPIGLFLTWLLIMLPFVLFIKLFVFIKNIFTSLLNTLIELVKILLDILNTLANWIDILTGPLT